MPRAPRDEQLRGSKRAFTVSISASMLAIPLQSVNRIAIDLAVYHSPGLAGDNVSAVSLDESGLAADAVVVQALRRAAEQVGGQRILAEKIGVHKVTLSRWITGRSSPSAEDLLRVADAAANGSVDRLLQLSSPDDEVIRAEPGVSYVSNEDFAVLVDAVEQLQDAISELVAESPRSTAAATRSTESLQKVRERLATQSGVG